MTPPTATAERPAPTSAGLGIDDVARLLVTGPDRPGIVATIASTLRDLGANIVSLDQYSTDAVDGEIFQRTEFHVPGLTAAQPRIEAAIAEVVGGLGLQWTLTRAAVPKRVAILASTTDHCLLDLLWRERRGELNMETKMVIANHPELADQVREFGVPYFHVPIDRAEGDAGKAAAEARHLELLRGNVDLVILARYMQIISPTFLEQVGAPVINIHHSFLPAFVGAGPYRKAKERGVKLIGATAHYVTEELDEGPIIEQDVVRVDHSHDLRELMRKGADVERTVLSRAVRAHCEDRVLRHGNATVVLGSG